MKIDVHLKVLYWIFLGASLSCSVLASDIQPMSIPITVNLDVQDRILCQMYLKCEGIRYDLPLDYFLKVPLRPSEQLLGKIITILSKKEVAKYNQYAYGGPPTEDAKELERRAKYMETGFNLLSKLLQDTNGIVIEYQILMGNLRVFYLSKPNVDRKKLVIPLCLIEVDSNVYWDFTETSVNYLRGMMTDSFQLLAETGQITVPPMDKKFDYEVPLTDTSLGHPVYVQFNGKRYQSDEYLSMSDNADKAASIMVSRHILTVSGYKDKIGVLYTEKSQKAYDEIIARNKPSEYEWMHRIWEKKPEIFFVIDADPIYPILYRKKEGFGLELAAQDNRDKKMKLTDLQVSGDFIHQLLNSQSFKNSFKINPENGTGTGADIMKKKN
jgi:hypothetical protein